MDPTSSWRLSLVTDDVVLSRHSSSGSTAPWSQRKSESPSPVHQRTRSLVDFVGGQTPDEEEDKVFIDHCWSQLVLTESHPLRLFWSSIVLVLLIYTASVFLYRFTFCAFHINELGEAPIGVNDPRWQAIDDLVDVLFWMDLFLTFFISYKDERGAEVDSMRLIAQRYLSGFFWINLIACLPEQFVHAVIVATSPDNDSANGSGVNKIARVARLQRVSRLARLARLTRLAKLASLGTTNTYWRWLQGLRGVRVVNFIGGLFWTMHLLACGWYLSAALQEDVRETWVGRHSVDSAGMTSLLTRGPFEQWLVSMYFVLTVFTTVGFGDISPGTKPEILAVAVIMVVGAVVHSIIISEVIQIITSTDQVQEFVDKQLKLFDAFSEHSELCPIARRRLKEELRFRSKHWAKSRSYDKQAIMELITGDHMPRWVIAEMSAGVFCGELMKNAFVTANLCSTYLPPRLPLLIAAHSIRARFETSEIVYQMHDFPFNLFLVLSGVFAHIARPTPHGGVDECIAERKWVPAGWHIQNSGCVRHISSSGSNIGQGLAPYKLHCFRSYFGDVELIQGRPRFSTVRCERAGEVLVLHKHAIAELQFHFPQFQNGWTHAARVREYVRQQACKRLTCALPMRRFAARRIQAFLTLEKVPRQRSGRLRHHLEVATSEALSGEAGQKQVLRRVENLCFGVNSLRSDFEAFRSEVRGLLQHKSVAQL